MSDAFKSIAQRQVNAENRFIDDVMEQFGKTKIEAEKVLQVYRKVGAVRIDPVTGQYLLKHGAFWELSVINNALVS